MEGPKLKYAKGGPLHRRRKDEDVGVPDPFDLSRVNERDPTFLPGGLLRALEDAERNRQRPLRGILWTLKAKTVLPGDWILMAHTQRDKSWWLVYTTTFEHLILVSRSGGYLKVDHTTLNRNGMDSVYNPPWWDRWVSNQLGL
jgi:hypothetical protein